MERDRESLRYEVSSEEYYAKREQEREEREREERESEFDQVHDDLGVSVLEAAVLRDWIAEQDARDWTEPISRIERMTARIREIRAELAAEMAALDKGQEAA